MTTQGKIAAILNPGRMLADGIPYPDYAGALEALDDGGDWFEHWMGVSGRYEHLGTGARAAGNEVSAGEWLWQASLSAHYAQFMWFHDPDRREAGQNGDYPACLRRAAEVAGHAEFAAEQERAREQGRYIGMGFGCFVEETGLGPYESGTVRIESSGKVTVLTGACSSGQGHATTLAQIAADELGVDLDDVTVLHGDTDLVRHGVGTYASRTAAVGGAAVRKAATKVRERAEFIAGQLMEVDPADLEVAEGGFAVAGSPAVSISLAEVATAVMPGSPLIDGVEEYGLEATDIFHPATNTFSYGVHVATVEVDVETGVVSHLRHVVVNDSGRVINPLILEGQVQGGVALGVGGALLEEILYDDDGQPRNPNFMDYLVPGIDNVSPEILVEHMEIPTPLNPDGIKGGGEGGAVGAPAAIANAVADAIRPARVTATPLFPARVHQAIVDAGLASMVAQEVT